MGFTMTEKPMSVSDTNIDDQADDQNSKLAWVKLWDQIEDHRGASQWHNRELCAAGDNCGVCVLSFLLPCVSLAHLARKAEVTGSLLGDAVCCLALWYPAFLMLLLPGLGLK